MKTGFIIIIVLAALLFAAGCYMFFYRRERRLLEHLQQMLDDAMDGNYKVSGFSEEKVSLLENSFKRYLDNSMIFSVKQKEQKEIIQRLISDIAHQTLTPISNLKLYTGLLQESYGNDERVETISEETEKLDFLIRSLVKLSRMENGIISVHPKEEKISKLISHAASLGMGKAETKGISLTADDTEETALFDLKWTEEALGNIVDNAVKYTDTGGSIHISVKRYSFFVRIDVSDTGIGIAEEDIPKIFARFYRSFEVADRPGVGIGLYLANYIVREQKGYIKVASEKGKGSVFSIFLPCQTQTESI